MYLVLAKNDKTSWYKSVISSVEVYDKHIITCHFSYLPVLPVSEVWNMGYSAPWTLLNNLFSSPGW